MAFCFPEKQDHPHYLSNDSGASIDYKLDKKSKAGRNKAKKANFYVKTPLNKDDVEEMKARAQQNKLFGAKYLDFFSSGSLKTREKYINFAQFVYFLREVCLLFN